MDPKGDDAIVHIEDNRISKPLVFHQIKDNLRVVIQTSETVEINGCQLSFSTPNTVSLFISKAKKELKAAHKLYVQLIDSKFNDKKIKIHKDKQLTDLFDYFEHIQFSIVSIYTAIEALSNIMIPDDYVDERLTNKGIKELWDKTAIERWETTSNKIGDIAPKILKIESPKKQTFWSEFKQLEAIRNDIIHQKNKKTDPNNIDTGYLNILLQKSIFKTIQAGFMLIDFICKSNNEHALFPVITGSTIKVIKVENLKDHIDILKEDGD